MIDAAIVARVRELRRELETHNYNYHVLDQPTIADAEWDKLFHELVALEAAHPKLVTPDSPTQRVGSAPVESFASVTHRVPMLSLGNAFSSEDIENFDRRCREGLDAAGEIDYACEPKFDGLAISLRYERGAFVQGATRGDGAVGEDVTHNLRTVRAIPLAIDSKIKQLEVRGEVLMLRKDFDALNARQLAKGEKLFVKLFYFLQELNGVPLGYDFRLFNYGPFDSEVLSDLSTACGLDAVAENNNTCWFR